MQKWRADELERKGGKFKDSHEWWPYKIEVFDYDNDGALDLLVAHHGPPGCKLLRNTIKETSKLTFVDVTSQMGVHSRDLPLADEEVAAWDFNGDGYLDIAGFSDKSRAPCFFNVGGKKLMAIPQFSFNPLAGFSRLSDVNGDGYLDVTGNSFSETTHTGTTYQFVYDPARRTYVKSLGDYVVPAIPQNI
jgi:hypothetical protein